LVAIGKRFSALLYHGQKLRDPKILDRRLARSLRRFPRIARAGASVRNLLDSVPVLVEAGEIPAHSGSRTLDIIKRGVGNQDCNER
jgi:hypothetical protein